MPVWHQGFSVSMDVHLSKKHSGPNSSHVVQIFSLAHGLIVNTVDKVSVWVSVLN